MVSVAKPCSTCGYYGVAIVIMFLFIIICSKSMVNFLKSSDRFTFLSEGEPLPKLDSNYAWLLLINLRRYTDRDMYLSLWLETTNHFSKEQTVFGTQCAPLLKQQYTSLCSAHNHSKEGVLNVCVMWQKYHLRPFQMSDRPLTNLYYPQIYCFYIWKVLNDS